MGPLRFQGDPMTSVRSNPTPDSNPLSPQQSSSNNVHDLSLPNLSTTSVKICKTTPFSVDPRVEPGQAAVDNALFIDPVAMTQENFFDIL